MIRTLIIDDEKECTDTLKADLQTYCASIEVIAVCNSAKQGLVTIRNVEPDLVFLDIEMPWMNGFEMLEFLGEIKFSIIFTTAYDQFAARAFRISAVDYLLKPVDFHDLQQAVKRVELKMNSGNALAGIENLLYNFRKPLDEQRIALPYRDGYEFAEINTVIACLAEGAYSHIHFSNGKKLLVSKSLGEIQEMLPADQFIRIHHSSIVNLRFVTHFLRTDGGYVQLKTGEKLMVSKSKKELLMERLGLRKNI
jgi:two-component system, LytTR family, response regulator